MTRLLGTLFLAAAPAMGSGAPTFTLTSTDITDGERIANVHVYKGMGCTGDNVSPELSWHDAPPSARSFAVTVYDPDAPTGSGWWHWLVYNLPGDTKELRRGAGNVKHPALPRGAEQGRTDFGEVGYGGPCPPPGKPHRYVFTVYALDVPHLDIPEGATAAVVGFNVHAHMIAKATLTAMYGR